jgi:hypothetical protein
MNKVEKSLHENGGATNFRFEKDMKAVADLVAETERVSLNDLLRISLRYYISTKHPEIDLPEIDIKWAKQKEWAKERKQKQTSSPALLFVGA